MCEPFYIRLDEFTNPTDTPLLSVRPSGAVFSLLDRDWINQTNNKTDKHSYTNLCIERVDAPINVLRFEREIPPASEIAHKDGSSILAIPGAIGHAPLSPAQPRRFRWPPLALDVPARVFSVGSFSHQYT